MRQRDDPDLNLPSFTSRPGVDPTSEGFWRAAGEGRLELQRCAGCASHRFPPAPICHVCGSDDSTWEALPGTGTIYTFTWVPDPGRRDESGSPAWANIVVVDLDGVSGRGVRMVSNLVDCHEPGSIRVGQSVTLECVHLEEGLGLPCFRSDP